MGIGGAWEGLASAVVALEATDLCPGPVVDALFGTVVRAALALPADHPQIALSGGRVRRLCARGEGLLEGWWAHRVVAGAPSLVRFPYLANYAELVRGEWSALVAALGRRPRRVAFVGSGPLPLTALVLQRLAPDVEVTCVDRDGEAVALGRAVAASLGTAGRSPRFVHADAADLDAAGFDAVVVAALVGETPAGKRAVVEALAVGLDPGAVLAVRSVPADGRQLLYPRVAVGELPGSVQVVGTWVPRPPVINSLVLLSRSSHI